MRGVTSLLRLQVVNGGSNLTYGIRTLYAKTFERFDKWLSGDVSALSGPDAEESKPKEPVLQPAPDVEQAQAEEAAAILESLITMTAPAVQQPPAQPVSKAINSKKRKTSEKRDAGKVRYSVSLQHPMIPASTPESQQGEQIKFFVLYSIICSQYWRLCGT